MNRIRQLRQARGYTQEALGKFLGVQKAAISKYEGGHANPPQDTLSALADLFHVSIDYLVGRSDDPTISKQAVSQVPVVGRVHAGAPILAEENVFDYMPVPESQLRSGQYFYMEVEGDCMVDAHIIEGALVLVKMQSRVDSGEIAVVRVDDEVVLRRVKWISNQLILYPANPQYEPMIIASGDVQIIGKVVEVRFQV